MVLHTNAHNHKQRITIILNPIERTEFFIVVVFQYIVAAPVYWINQLSLTVYFKELFLCLCYRAAGTKNTGNVAVDLKIAR